MQNNRWLLPVLLALIIAVIVVVAVFGKSIKNAVSPAPTATPTLTPTPMPSATPKVVKQVVTATPGNNATATAQAAAGSNPTGTPGSSAAAPPSTIIVATPPPHGGSTPLPGATPYPTVQGVTIGMITHSQHQILTIQQEANRKNPNYQYFLNPTLVVQRNLPQYGFTGGFTITQPSPSATPAPTPFRASDGRPTITYTVQWQNKVYSIDVAQVVQTGAGGIWMIVTIRPAST